MTTPHKKGDTMTDAIALSSPNGRMSKRARKAAEARLAGALFGPGSGFEGFNPPTSADELRRQRIVQLESHLQDCKHFAARHPRSRTWPREIQKVLDELAELRGAK